MMLLLMIVDKMSVGSPDIIIEGPSAYGRAAIAAFGTSSSVIIILSVVAVVAVVVVAIIITVRLMMLSSSDDVVDRNRQKK